MQIAAGIPMVPDGIITCVNSITGLLHAGTSYFYNVKFATLN